MRTPIPRTILTLWRRGRGYSLEAILPPASSHGIDSVTAINRGVPLLATNCSRRANAPVILTLDQNTSARKVYGNFGWARGIATINSTPGTATTVVDDEGYTAVRVNLPPIAFNKDRISIEITLTRKNER